MAREFKSQASNAVETAEEVAPFDFKLDGETFIATIRQDADAILEWSELAATAGDEDVSTQAGAAFIGKFFKLMMEGPEYQRFRTHLRVHKTSGETITEIMQALNEEMEQRVEADNARPTQPSSDSSDGVVATVERRLTIASLPDGDVEYADPPRVERQAQRATQVRLRQPQDYRPRKTRQRRKAG